MYLSFVFIPAECNTALKIIIDDFVEKRVPNPKYPDMLPETRAMLDNFYAPFNRRLAELLCDNKFLYGAN